MPSFPKAVLVTGGAGFVGTALALAPLDPALAAVRTVGSGLLVVWPPATAPEGGA